MTREGLSLLKRMEGLRLAPYICPAGKPTIGYGITVYPNGTPVTMSDPPITAEQALDMLKAEVARYEAKVDELTGGKATPYELSAMTSLAYNIGLEAFATSSVRRLYNQGRLREAAAAFALWNKITVDGRKVVNQGLVRRRAEEATMFLGPVDSQDMPQEVSSPQPVSQSRTAVGVVTSATGGVATVAAGVQAVSDLKSSVDGLGPWLPYLLGAGAILGIIGICYVLYARWDDRRQGLR